jgi:hypothetical protein
MKFYPSLMLSELSPPENAQTKVNGCGIQCIHITVNLNFEIGFITAFSGFLDQDIGKLLKDSIDALFFGFAKIPASYGLAKTKVIVFGLMGFKTQHQITHTVS